MNRKLTSHSSLETLKREAKRWLKALREQDRQARTRLLSANPNAPATPGLREVQHALAKEYGYSGWTELKRALAQRTEDPAPDSRDAAIQELLGAADKGDVTRVRQVIDAFPDIVNERALLPGHSGRRSALHFAMNCLSEPVTDLLLERGADPNLRDEGDLAMPLHFAVEKGHFGIVRQLIEHGADPIGAGDYHELEVIGWATCFGDGAADLVDYLLSHGGRHTIFSAVATGATEAIRNLVAVTPADVNRPMDATNRRRRPLHLAVIKKQPDSLATLLDIGADVEALDAGGLTPLDQAALSGEKGMVQLLIDHGAVVRLPAATALERHDDIKRLLRDDPDALRSGGRWDKILIRAGESASGAAIETLLRAGASVNVSDDRHTAVDGTNGYSALHAAAFHGNAEAVRVLLEHGANVAGRDERYWGTPAGWANHAGHIEVRDLILEGPIDIFDAIQFDRHSRIEEVLLRDPAALERPVGESVSGEPKPWLDPAWTPLAFAVANGKLDAVRVLIDLGASGAVRDSTGRSLIAMATANGWDDIAAFLERPGWT